MTYRSIAIPRRRVSEALKRARSTGDSYPCAVCGVHVPRAKVFVHMIEGGGVALHCADAEAYVPDGGDMGMYPVGSDCIKAHPELKPYIFNS